MRRTPATPRPSVEGDPRFVANLAIWEAVEAMDAIVWTTAHRQLYSRRAEWFEVLGKTHFVMWWIEVGHRPTLEEGLERLAHLEIHGDSEHAFGWRHLPQVRLWRDRGCGAEAGKRASACRDDLSGK